MTDCNDERFERIEIKLDQLKEELSALFRNGPISKIAIEQAEQRTTLKLLKNILAAIGMTTLALISDAFARFIK